MTTVRRDQLATFRIDPQSWTEFQSWAKGQEVSASLALCKLVEFCLSGKIQDLKQFDIATADSGSASDREDLIKTLEGRLLTVEADLSFLKSNYSNLEASLKALVEKPQIPVKPLLEETIAIAVASDDAINESEVLATPVDTASASDDDSDDDITEDEVVAVVGDSANDITSNGLTTVVVVNDSDGDSDNDRQNDLTPPSSDDPQPTPEEIPVGTENVLVEGETDTLDEGSRATDENKDLPFTMTQQEMAEHLGINLTTLNSWAKKAEAEEEKGEEFFEKRLKDFSEKKKIQAYSEYKEEGWRWVRGEGKSPSFFERLKS